MTGARTDRAGGTHRRAVPGRSPWQRFVVWWRRRITWGRAVWRRLSLRPGVAHLVRAGERFSDRMGNHFAAAITYFSFLSLVPIVMVAFATAGFVLSSRPDLLDALKDQVISLVGGSFGDLIDKAVDQRTAVGIIGLVVAAYSGLSWIGNVRDAVQAQWRPHWVRVKAARQNFLMDTLSDLVSLLGLLAAVVVTFALTAVGTAAQDLVVGWLGLDDVGWLRPVLTIGPFVLAIAADVLIFAWVYTIMPYKGYRARRRTLLIGSLAMAVAFEVLKAALTLVVSRLSSSPSGAVFGTVIGLLFFFNLVARVFLMVAAWIATGAEQPSEEPSAPTSSPQPAVTVMLQSPQGHRSGAAFGIGAVLGWLYGRRRRR
jgi:membrane protein